MEIKPCSTGSLVFAAAAAIGADPRPDSLEKTPRATPFWIAILTVAPAKPPMAAVPVKAPEKTDLYWENVIVNELAEDGVSVLNTHLFEEVPAAFLRQTP